GWSDWRAGGGRTGPCGGGGLGGWRKGAPGPATPLFHVQPSGWPSMIHMSSGFFSRAARSRAAARSVSHGISVHRSPSPRGATAACSLWNCSSGSARTSKPGTGTPPSRPGCGGGCTGGPSERGGTCAAGRALAPSAPAVVTTAIPQKPFTPHLTSVYSHYLPSRPPVCLEFRLQNADLFAFEFTEPDPSRNR